MSYRARQGCGRLRRHRPHKGRRGSPFQLSSVAQEAILIHRKHWLVAVVALPSLLLVLAPHAHGVCPQYLLAARCAFFWLLSLAASADKLLKFFLFLAAPVALELAVVAPVDRPVVVGVPAFSACPAAAG